jgi:hypothetical protein
VELGPLLPPCACELLVDVVCRMKKENREEEKKRERKKKKKNEGEKVGIFFKPENFQGEIYKSIL